MIDKILVRLIIMIAMSASAIPGEIVPEPDPHLRYLDQDPKIGLNYSIQTSSILHQQAEELASTRIVREVLSSFVLLTSRRLHNALKAKGGFSLNKILKNLIKPKYFTAR
jgi:hypothetical protein